MWNDVIKQIKKRFVIMMGIKMDSRILALAPRLEYVEFKSHNEQFTLVPFENPKVTQIQNHPQ
jgi:hypothetical protein